MLYVWSLCAVCSKCWMVRTVGGNVCWVVATDSGGKVCWVVATDSGGNMCWVVATDSGGNYAGW